MAEEFVCSSCGATHEFPTFAWDYPLPVFEVPAGGRERRVQLAPDECIIGDADHFVRGCIQIPVHGKVEPFIWGVWARVTRSPHSPDAAGGAGGGERASAHWT